MWGRCGGQISASVQILIIDFGEKNLPQPSVKVNNWR